MNSYQQNFTRPDALVLVPYDQRFLELSWHWLNDPETRELTMTPIFTRADQRKFFESLPLRVGYKIWGVALGNQLIGAAGLKNFRGALAEYWGYIGEKRYWGLGLGAPLLQRVEEQARSFELRSLDLHVLRTNLRAIHAYKKSGFMIDELQSNSKTAYMIKDNIE